MKIKTMKQSVLGLAGLAMLLASCSRTNSGEVKQLDGAGATFPMPYYSLAFKNYHEAGMPAINYGGIGSGGGIRSLKDKVVDFAASDAFLSDEESSGMDEVVHMPTCMGAVVLAYKLEGIDRLKLDAKLIADIYLGKINRWNDSKIKEANPELQLPDKEITPVYRSDGSGTTFVFSDFMSKASPEWAERLGTGKSLDWPNGLAAKGNPGVAGIIAQTEGAIGYIGSEYSMAQNIPSALIRNAAGNYIAPSLESISAAATGDIPADTRAMITNAEGADAYPISCLTWILLYKDQDYNKRSEEQAKATVDLMRWLLSDEAQSMASKVNYAPLPSNIIELANKQLDGINYQGKAL